MICNFAGLSAFWVGWTFNYKLQIANYKLSSYATAAAAANCAAKLTIFPAPCAIANSRA